MTAPLVHVEREVDAPADALWAVIAEFARPQRLAPTIVQCTVEGAGPGAVRRVTSSRGLVIRERLVECDEHARRLVYEVVPDGDMPFAGLTEYRAQILLVPVDAGRTRVSWIAEGAVDGDASAAIEFLRGLYGQAIGRLASVAREGEPAA